MLTSQDVFWVVGAIAVGLLALFGIRSRPKEPSRLDLRSGRGGYRAQSAELKTLVPAKRGPLNKTLEILDPATEAASEMQNGKEKSLNVMFNYNGHTWDAYEVLGLPAGAPLKAAQHAYEEALKRTKPDSHEFLTTAFRAIQIRSRSGGSFRP